MCQDKSGIPSVRKGAIRFVQVLLILPPLIFLCFHCLRRQLVHNIQNDPRSLITIYKVPVVRISPLNSAGIHFELHTFGSSVFGYVFFPLFHMWKNSVTDEVLENNDICESCRKTWPSYCGIVESANCSVFKLDLEISNIVNLKKIFKY